MISGVVKKAYHKEDWLGGPPMKSTLALHQPTITRRSMLLSDETRMDMLVADLQLVAMLLTAVIALRLNRPEKARYITMLVR